MYVSICDVWLRAYTICLKGEWEMKRMRRVWQRAKIKWAPWAIYLHEIYLYTDTHTRTHATYILLLVVSLFSSFSWKYIKYKSSRESVNMPTTVCFCLCSVSYLYVLQSSTIYAIICSNNNSPNNWNLFLVSLSLEDLVVRPYTCKYQKP